MALTDFSDLFVSFHENGFNNIVIELQRQRPSLFNYGTSSYVSNPNLLCYLIYPKKIDPEVITHPDPVVKLEPPMTIPGYDGPYGLQYCFQLSELSIDFSPNNIHNLPPEIKPLFKDQCFSIKARVCGEINCPSKDFLQKVAPQLPAFAPDLNNKDLGVSSKKDTQVNADYNRDKGDEPTPTMPLTPLPINRESKNCFCIDLYVVCNLEREGNPTDPILGVHLDGLEIVDIKPDALESSIECFLTATLILGILPRVKLAMNAFVLQIKNFLTIEPTPIGGTVPNNPSIEKDQLKIFVTLVP